MSDSQLVTETLAKFASQFQGSEKLMNLMRAFLQPIDELLDTSADLKNNRCIDTAVGAQLDQLGAIVGMPRFGRLDDDYRRAIRFQIFINLSKTEPETMITALRVLSEGDFLRYWEHADGAGFHLFTNGPKVFSDSDATFEFVRFALDDDELLALDTSDNLLLKTVFRKPFDVLIFLRSIAAAGVDLITLSYSLGQTPLFGFGYEFDTGRLVLSSGEFLSVTSDAAPTRLEVFTDRYNGMSPDGFLGFAEISPSPIELDDGTILAVNYLGEDVPIYVDYNGLTVGGGKLAEGTRDYG